MGITSPTYSGTINSWSTSPALPSGMVVTSTGLITGIPAVSAAQQDYLIIGTGPDGSDTAVVTITVNAASENFNTWSGHRSIKINTSVTGANTATNVLKYPLLVAFGVRVNRTYSPRLSPQARTCVSQKRTT